MKRDELIKKLLPVKDLIIHKNMTISELIIQMKTMGGFTARKLAEAAEILLDMINDPESTNFLSFPACIIATGTRGLIKELIRRKFFHVIITTVGTVDHDLARIWRPYYNGWFDFNDTILHEMDIHRLGNVFIPAENYGLIIEEKTQEFLNKLYENGKRRLSTKELIWELGKEIGRYNNREESIIWWAMKNKIPMYIPGPTDGAFGYQLWQFSQDKKDFIVDVLADEKDLADIVFESKRTGALIIGGGISKHHVIWWNQFKGGLDRVVYITTAVEWDGSLSGARPKEAISWGKINEKAKKIIVEGDATVLLPLLFGYIINQKV
ncbi:MAG: deoxyhypusine synthase [Candidatus Njordarchaeum guaymaensis]